MKEPRAESTFERSCVCSVSLVQVTLLPAGKLPQHKKVLLVNPGLPGLFEAVQASFKLGPSKFAVRATSTGSSTIAQWEDRAGRAGAIKPIY